MAKISLKIFLNMFQVILASGLPERNRTSTVLSTLEAGLLPRREHALRLTALRQTERTINYDAVHYTKIHVCLFGDCKMSGQDFIAITAAQDIEEKCFSTF